MTDPSLRDPDEALFDAWYASAQSKDPRSIPWANGAPKPLFAAWLATVPPPSEATNRALVVACGLGDDAEALAERGWRVEAFDVAPHAIDWARDRFPLSRVSYRVASLFDLPEVWRQAFDLVVEVHTVQALPVTRRQETIGAIAATVAPGGALVAVTMTREGRVPSRGRPWLLTPRELASFERHGLAEVERAVVPAPSPDRPARIRATFTRPVDASALGHRG